MNTKFFKSLAAVAVAVLIVGCAKEQVSPVDGEICEATFNVAVPRGISTKAIADGTTAKELWYQVFDKDGNVIAGLGKTKHESLLSDRQTSVSVQLVKDQTYNIVFWAQSEGQTCYKFDDLSQITVDYAAAKANEESRDAFLAVKKITVNGPISETVMMKRPFAQLNIGTADAAIAAKAGVVIKTSKVEMKGLPNVLNTIKGTTDGAVDVTFADNAVPSTEVLSVNGKEYTYLAMNYILAPAEGKEISDVKATFTAEGKDPVSLSAFSVPFQRNYRTNIIGNILTNSADFHVIVVPDFEDGDKVYDLDKITTPGALKALFANGGSGKLMEDVDVESFIRVPSGKTVILDLNGHKIENTVDLWNKTNAVVIIDGGNLIIKGSGTIKAKANDCYTFNVKGAGRLIIEDGEFVGNVSVIQIEEGSAEVRGGKFSLTQTWPAVGNGYDYTINLIDQAGKEGVATAKVLGGSFYKFDPSDNNSENPKKNFVADGYKSTLVGDYYVVTKKDVTPVANNAGFQAAIESAASGETIVLTESLTLTSTSIVSDKNVKIDLADNTLVLKENIRTSTSGENADEAGVITFKNGTIKCVGTNSLYPSGKSKMELDNVTLTSAEDSPILVQNTATLIVKNSKINAKIYGITTNAGNPNQNVTIVVDNCEITAGEPILVNIPCNLTVTKSTMNGKWHGTVVRGGTATFTDCKIVLDYVDSDAADVAANYNWMGATWGSGNSITIAAMVLGNHAPSAYQYPTNVTLKNTTVACEGVNASLFPSVYSYANQGEGLGVTFNYDTASNLESGKGPVYNSANIVVNGVEIKTN